MTEDERMQVAVFRFSVIGDFVTGVQMSRTEKRRLMREKSARKWQIPFSEKTRISMGTIGRWCRCYRNSNGDLENLNRAATALGGCELTANRRKDLRLTRRQNLLPSMRNKRIGVLLLPTLWCHMAAHLATGQKFGLRSTWANHIRLFWD